MRTPKTKFSAQGNLFSPEGQRAGNKRQGQGTEEEGNREKGKEYLSQSVTKGLPLDREETEAWHMGK